MELPTYPPGLGVSCPERLLLVGAVFYLILGLAYLALTGVSDAWERCWQPQIGTGVGDAAVAAALWTVAVALWPVLLGCQTARALCSRRAPAPDDQTVWRRPASSAGLSAPAPPVTLPVVPPPLPVPPRWFRQEYEAVRVVLAEGRTVVARCWASGLVDDATLAFGDSHPYTRDAWELLAHVVRTALAEHWATAPACEALPAAGHFLLPHGRQAAGYGVGHASVYVTGPQPIPRR